MNPIPAKGERALIRDIRHRLHQPQWLGPVQPPAPGDDLAAISPAFGDLMWSADLLMEGVDFEPHQHSWQAIGAKAIKVNLSDCAACGVRPVACLLSLSLSNKISYDDALALVDGLDEVARAFDCPLMGGDTNSWDAPTAINVTIAARPEPGTQPLLRSGARPGDLLCLTGAVGGSLLGRHMTFTPRVEVGLQLAELPATAAIDVSDGVAIDLWHICDASNCGAEIDAAALDRLTHEDAFRRAAQTASTPREHALFDGEDFELLATVPAETPPDTIEDLGLSVLGRITAERGVYLLEKGNRTEVPRKGWEHFQ